MLSSIHKKTIVFLAVALTSLLLWAWLRPWIESPYTFTHAGLWIRPLALLLLSLPIFTLPLILLDRRLYKIISSLIVVGMFFVAFGYAWVYFIGGAALVLLSLYAERAVRQELASRTTIDARTVFSAGMKPIVTGLLIMISFAYFLSPVVQASARGQELPTNVRKVVEFTVDNLLGRNPQRVVQDDQVKNQLIDNVVVQIAHFLGPYVKYAPPVLAFGLFLLLQGVSFLFVWVGGFVGALLFFVLKKIGFIQITEKSVKAETIAVF